MNSKLAPLEGKVAVVTGGSNGIGAAAVRLLANAGCKIVLCYNTGEARANQLIAELPGSDHRAIALTLADGASVRNLAERVREAYGKLDIVVNSAGFTHPIAHGDLNALTDELFDAMLIANVRGPFSVIRALNPLLQESGDGVIVNVSSVSGATGSGSSIAYCASKAALDTMTISLARVLGPNVRVMCVAPGAVATGFVAGRDRGVLEKLAQSTPLRRVVEPEDVARAIMTCIVDLRASTGLRLVVDGGRSLA